MSVFAVSPARDFGASEEDYGGGPNLSPETNERDAGGANSSAEPSPASVPEPADPDFGYDLLSMVHVEALPFPEVAQVEGMSGRGESPEFCTRYLKPDMSSEKTEPDMTEKKGGFDVETALEKTRKEEGWLAEEEIDEDEEEILNSLDGNFQDSQSNEIQLSNEIEQDLIFLQGVGMGYADISAYLRNLYGLGIPIGTLSAATDKIARTMNEWLTRPLANIYPIVWLDICNYKIREDGKVVIKTVCTILGVNFEGRNESLGLYICEREGANFWMQVLADLARRGVKDILIACVYGLKGFSEAIEALFPKTEVQLCVAHQILNSLKYVVLKNQKEFMTDLEPIYKANSEDQAVGALDVLAKKWNDKYSIVIKNWQNNWVGINQIFKYPEDIRRIIYTTNTIEAVHYQFRKLTKATSIFSHQESLLKLLYLGIQTASKKWEMPIPNWSQTISMFAIFFEGRMEQELKIR